VDLYFQFS